MKFYARMSKNSTLTVLGRMTARDGTGAYTGVRGEGNWLTQSDVASITCSVYDTDGDGGTTTPVATPTVTLGTSIIVPDATGHIWTKDAVGYNFIHDIANTAFANSNHRYSVVYIVTLNNGAVFTGTWSGMPADPLDE